MSDETQYGYVKQMPGTDYEDAIAKVTEALKAEGFGILTEINVRETFRNKLDIDFRPYIILGACNPNLAYNAIGVDPQIGMLLPCNVVVQKTDDGSIVSIADPKVMAQMADSRDLEPIVKDADERIRRVMEAL